MLPEEPGRQGLPPRVRLPKRRDQTVRRHAPLHAACVAPLHAEAGQQGPQALLEVSASRNSEDEADAQASAASDIFTRAVSAKRAQPRTLTARASSRSAVRMRASRLRTRAPSAANSA